MRVEDWIAWKPDGTIWRPYNLKEVESSGVETRVSYAHTFSKIDLEVGGMYAYNRAVLLKRYIQKMMQRSDINCLTPLCTSLDYL